jgi:hypothetical protein
VLDTGKGRTVTRKSGDFRELSLDYENRKMAKDMRRGFSPMKAGRTESIKLERQLAAMARPLDNKRIPLPRPAHRATGQMGGLDIEWEDVNGKQTQKEIKTFNIRALCVSALMHGCGLCLSV